MKKKSPTRLPGFYQAKTSERMARLGTLVVFAKPEVLDYLSDKVFHTGRNEEYLATLPSQAGAILVRLGEVGHRFTIKAWRTGGDAEIDRRIYWRVRIKRARRRQGSTIGKR